MNDQIIRIRVGLFVLVMLALLAVLITLFGVTALALAAIGLYAVMAASVRLRRREIGIRIAIGATAFHVQRLVLGEGARLAGLGGALGLVLAVLTSRVLRGLLFDTHLDMPGRERDPDRHAAARALVQASNGVMLDVLDAAIELIAEGVVTTATDDHLLELARLARREDQLIRRQMDEVVRSGRESLYEALFR